MDLKNSIPIVPDWPKPGVNFLDICGLLRDTNALRYCVDFVADSIRSSQATSVIAVESRGFLFAGAACAATATPLYLARKAGKLPGTCHTIHYDTEYSQDAISMQASADPGARPLIVDDLLATGGTIMAVANLIRQNWVTDSISASVIVNLGFLPGQSLLHSQSINLDFAVTYHA